MREAIYGQSSESTVANRNEILAKDIFIEQLVWLGCGVQFRKNPSDDIDALNRILFIGRVKVGEVCHQVCSREVHNLKARHFTVATAMPHNEQLNWCNPGEVQVDDFRLKMTKLNVIFADMNIIEPPSHSRWSPTSTAATNEFTQHFPPPRCQHIKWLAEIISCKSLTAVTEEGWNIFHYLFQCVTPSLLAARIAANMASSQIPMLDGDMRQAIRQKTTGPYPHGWTPLHFLCSDSDGAYQQKRSD